MNKTLLGIAGAALLCFLGGPFATGLIAENHLRSRVAAMDTNNPWLSAEVGAYDRGWFSSRAVVALGLTIDDAQTAFPAGAGLLDALATPVPIVIDVRHGPLSLGDGVGVAYVTAQPDRDDPRISELTELLGVPQLFEFRGRSGFSGRFDFDADIPPFTYPASLGETRFSGLHATGSAHGRTLSISGEFDELGLQGPLAAGAIESLTLDLNYEFREDRLPLGAGTISVARAVATSPLMGNAPLFELEGLSISQAMRLADDADTLDADALYRADRIVTGEGTTVNEAEFGVRLTGVDSQAVADYYTTVNAAMNAQEFDPEALTAQLSPVLDRLFRRGFRVDVTPARFDMDAGGLDANVALAIDGASLDPSLPVDARNMAVLLGVLSVDAELTVAKPLARELAARAMRAQLAATDTGGGEPFSEAELDAAADAQAGLTLATLAGQGLIDDDGSDYKVIATFADGALTVNGSPLGPGLF